ncbi:hypothetical protein [Streptomyces gobitricini]|uniref:hypothetical protein n=1 Tax=Streptomyces gobitricini TaxID=68211 RepID=UPI0031D9BD0B
MDSSTLALDVPANLKSKLVRSPFPQAVLEKLLLELDGFAVTFAHFPSRRVSSTQP